MPVTVVVGAQYGGEGKGKTTAYLSASESPALVVRCGGPNSGHTVDLGQKTYILRLVPAGFVSPNTRLLIAPGAIVDLNVLRDEIDLLGIRPDRLGIDRNTGIIEQKDVKSESTWNLGGRIGSTGTGMGAAVARRSARASDFTRAQDVPELSEWVTDVAEEVNSGLDENRSVIVEGTQGFGLSLLHSPHFPYVTSRDTTAAAFLSEVGISPRRADRILMVVRTFPIRVGGNSGPLPSEIDWEEVRRISGSPHPVEEYTTVTERLRRVGMFEESIVRRATMINRPTHIVVNGLDLIDHANRSARNPIDLTQSATDFLAKVASLTQVGVLLGGVGPRFYDFVRLPVRLGKTLEVISD